MDARGGYPLGGVLPVWKAIACIVNIYNAVNAWTFAAECCAASIMSSGIRPPHSFFSPTWRHVAFENVSTFSDKQAKVVTKKEI